MVYQALARQWRPKQFSEVVGQAHIITALTQALNTQRIHHAYLFTGTHGTGKTSTARIFAKCLNCETGITSTPCERCSACRNINEGKFPDLYEIDAASRTKVEDTRDLLDNIPYAPSMGRYKVYLIDEVHMLSGHSFNALLKTLEEPPAHVLFLLATTDPQKLPATVLSRCLQFHLSKMQPSHITQQLEKIVSAEKITFESEALALLAEAANGSMRDALSLLDQAIAFSTAKLTLQQVQQLLGLSSQTDLLTLLQDIAANDAQAILTRTNQWAGNGVNFNRCLSALLTVLYRLTLIHAIGYKDAALRDLATKLSSADTMRLYRIALTGQHELALAPTTQIGFEMLMLRMLSPTSASVTTSPTVSDPKKIMDWHDLLPMLGLSGQCLAIAQHCACPSFNPEHLALVLHPKYQALLNDKHRSTLQNACEKQLGHPVRLSITVTPHAEATPAERYALQEKTRKTDAKSAIVSTPAIQKIMETFDANISEDGIETIN